jgi:hypothetical protein
MTVNDVNRISDYNYSQKSLLNLNLNQTIGVTFDLSIVK